MTRYTWIWCIILCTFSFWFGAIIFYLLDIKKDLNIYNQHCMQLFDKFDAKVMNSEAMILSKIDKIRMSIAKNNLVVGKDGCVKEKCLSKLLLSVIDLRESFFNSTLTKNKIYTVKQILQEIDDHDIESAINTIEELLNKEISTFIKLKGSFKIIINNYHYKNASSFEKLLSKWILIKNNNNKLWKNLTKLEFYISNNYWTDALDFAKRELHSFHDLQLWITQLEDLVIIEKSISVIYNQLLKHIIAASGNT
ncbi:LITAF-like zinc ribbon domain-containing protein [Candidatus Neoehrlichia procyonis]|nr:hypothetical protein [Candidatus Neoehrlichia lotoris]